MRGPTDSVGLAAVLDAATGLALVATDLEGRITGFSRGAELMLGYAEGEVLGTSPLAFHRPEELAARGEALALRLGRPIQGFEILTARLDTAPHDEGAWTWVRKDGTALTVNLRITLLPSPDGGRAGYLGTATDISALKETEAALLRERLFFEQVINGLPGVFYLYGADLRLKRWNRNHATLLGYTDEELKDVYVGDWHPTPEIADLAVQATRGIIEQGVQLDAIESSLLHKNGTYVPFLLTGVRIESVEGPMMAGIGIDLTERRKLEEQLRQAQKMESIGRLAGGVAHDFNNLLTTIVCNLEMIRQTTDPALRTGAYVEAALKASESGTRLTRQLLAFSRKEIISPRVVDLNAVLQTVRAMLDRLLGEDIAFSTEPFPGLWPTRIDPGQLDQIILNLAVNARDAMPDGGRLHMRTANVTLDEAAAARHPGAAPGDYVLLAVSDTGVGMAPEVQSRIFEPFFTTKELGHGTGLGLATVFGTLEQNGGFVDVTSAPGAGSTFSVHLPRAQGAVPELSEALRQERPRGGSETLLLVEDDAGIRQVAEEYLTLLGYRVLACADGRSAMDAALAAGTIHLLVTDLIMPGMNGRELAEHLSKRLNRLKVLFTSGYTADIITRHGMLEPGIDFLPKPYSPTDLAWRVRACLDRRTR
ncbi:MAG TPA: PAS domain S-box protein [Holophaga sp.]|nr:PAS domain S-box protein [Holophaga sp.]